MKRIISYTVILLTLIQNFASAQSVIINQTNFPSAQISFAESELKKSFLVFKHKFPVKIVFKKDISVAEQGYRVINDGKNSIAIYSSDATGAMYGGLSLAEKIRFEKSISNLSLQVFAEPFIKNEV